MQTGREVDCQDDRAQCYAFPDRNKANASVVVNTCTTLICDRMVDVLFDPSSIYSYVSLRFASNFEMMCDVFDL